ncbi:hypothetical protein MKX03_031795, partial [Papaver bracteatum]
LKILFSVIVNYLHFHLWEMIWIGQKKFRRAIQLLHNVVTAPMQSLNCIDVEAYKKYILVNLIQKGQVASNGYGFVVFCTRASAEEVLQTYNGSAMQNNL